MAENTNRSWRLALAACASMGCFVPISNAVPHGASTAGKGALRITGTVEYPVIDQLATTSSPPDASAPNTYPTSQAPYGSIQATYGVTDEVDVDVGLDGEVQGVLPVPHGGYLGFRYVPYRGGNVRIGLGARFGYSGFAASYTTEPFDDSTVRVYHGAASLLMTVTRWPKVQPTFGVSVQPIRADGLVQGTQMVALRGMNAAATLGLRVYWVTPFVTAGFLTTDNVRGQAPYFTFGLAKSL